MFSGQDPLFATQHQIMNLDYDGGTNVVYLGLAAPGTGDSVTQWLVVKFTYDGSNNVLTKRFASGSLDYNKTWTGRAGFAYS